MIDGPEWDQIWTSGIEWGGDVDVDSRHVLAGPNDEHTTGDLDGAVAFLTATLADGAMPAAGVKKLARQDDHASRTLKRAKEHAGVRSRKEGFGKQGTWWWYLPGHESPAPGYEPKPAEKGQNLRGPTPPKEAQPGELARLDDSLMEQGKEAPADPKGGQPLEIGPLSDEADPEPSRFVDEWGNPIEPWDEP